MIKWKSREIVEVEEDILMMLMTMTMTTKWKNYNENRISSKEICGENKLTIWRPIANTQNTIHLMFCGCILLQSIWSHHRISCYPTPRVQQFFAISRMAMDSDGSSTFGIII